MSVSAMSSLAMIVRERVAANTRDPALRHAARNVEYLHADVLEEMTESKLAHLPHARGRVCDSTGKFNATGRINSARFRSYDQRNRMLTLRLDDSSIPEFWAEVSIPLDQLEAWIGTQIDESDASDQF